MFIDRKKLREDLFGLVGFYNADNPDYPTLVPSLLESRSGKYVNEANMSLLSIENIDQSIKNFSKFNYDEFSTTTKDNGGYTTGSKVLYTPDSTNYEYIATSASNNTTPDPPDASAWREIDELSDYLIKSVYTGIDEMTDAWIRDKKGRLKIKSIFDKIYLFQGVANYRNVQKNGNNFVGLRIRMKRPEKSLAVIINQLGHHFNAAFTSGTTGTLPIYLFHTSQQEALFTFQLEHSKASSSIWTQWDTDNNVLRYVSDEYDAGGDFYIGYKQSDLEALGAEAYRYDVNWRNPGCGSCKTANYFYKQYSNFIDVVGFQVAEDRLGPGDTLFNPNDASLVFSGNFGLNLNLTSRCDVGYLFEQDEYLTQDALNLSVAMVLMRNIAHNTRGGNNLANQTKQEAKREIYSHKEAKGTLKDRWDDSIKALTFDLSGLGDACFPCDDLSDEPVIINTQTLY